MNSSELKGYLTGLIIGDGCIDGGVTKRAFEIKSIRKGFIDKIFNDLQSCTNFNITVRYKKAYIDKNNVNHKECWILRIKSHPYFAKKYHNFYDDYRHRLISKNALNWINPIGLANWYMSDGYICLVGRKSGIIRSRRMDICTDRYSHDNIKLMQKMFFDRFGIITSLNKRGDTYRIRIKKDSYCDFINIIKDHVVNDMIYKLYLGYDKQPIWMSDSDWEFQNSVSAIALSEKSQG